MIAVEIADETGHALPDLVGEVRRRRTDQLVDVADRGLGHLRRFWHTIQAMPASETLLDELLPRYDHRTAQGRPVRASVETVARAIRETDLREAKLARTLLGVRTLGSSLRGGGRIAELGDGAPGFVPLAETPNEVVIGFVGQPWPGGTFDAEIEDRAGFVAHEPTSSVKVAMSVRCDAAVYGTLLVTETRILVGPLARRPFSRYWRLIRPGSDLVRGSLLRAIARRAQHAA
jgi:hypothetical protein